MANPTRVTSFEWGDIELSQTVLIDNIPHVTRAAVGEWLEYTYPQNAIDIVLRRNPHVENYSVPVNLTGTDGKKYDTRVYHPIGFLLLVMESGQPKAKAMKVAVAEFVWYFAKPKNLGFKEKMELQRYQLSLCTQLSRSKDSLVHQVLLERLKEVCLELGQTMPDPALLGQDISQPALEGM